MQVVAEQQQRGQQRLDRVADGVHLAREVRGDLRELLQQLAGAHDQRPARPTGLLPVGLALLLGGGLVAQVVEGDLLLEDRLQQQHPLVHPVELAPVVELGDLVAERGDEVVQQQRGLQRHLVALLVAISTAAGRAVAAGDRVDGLRVERDGQAGLVGVVEDAREDRLDRELREALDHVVRVDVRQLVLPSHSHQAGGWLAVDVEGLPLEVALVEVLRPSARSVGIGAASAGVGGGEGGHDAILQQNEHFQVDFVLVHDGGLEDGQDLLSLELLLLGRAGQGGVVVVLVSFLVARLRWFMLERNAQVLLLPEMVDDNQGVRQNALVQRVELVHFLEDAADEEVAALVQPAGAFDQNLDDEVQGMCFREGEGRAE